MFWQATNTGRLNKIMILKTGLPFKQNVGFCDTRRTYGQSHRRKRVTFSSLWLYFFDIILASALSGLNNNKVFIHTHIHTFWLRLCLGYFDKLIVRENLTHINFIHEVSKSEGPGSLGGPHTCTSKFGKSEGAFGRADMDNGRAPACQSLGRSPTSQFPSRPLRRGMVTPSPWIRAHQKMNVSW